VTDYTIASPNGGTWTIQLTDNATVGRYHDLAFLMDGVSGSGNAFKQCRPGVLVGPAISAGSNFPGQLSVNPTSGLGWSVQPGAAVLERNTLSGTYLVESTAVGTGAVGTADPSQTRVDRLDLQVFDGVLGDNSSTSLTRVHVTPGTPGSGLPGPPVVPGATILLGYWTIPATTTTLTTGMWTDARKSAGLRGGARVLLPGDALADPGFVVCEERWRFHSTYGWLNDYWDAAGGLWRGTKEIGGFAQSWQGGTSNVTLNTSTFTPVIQVSIADPGFPYLIEADAQMISFSISAWTAGLPPLTNTQITLTSTVGTVLSSAQWGGNYTAAGASFINVLPPRQTAVVTGAQTVILSAQSVTSLGGGTQGASYAGYTSQQSYLNVKLIPA
jgi:hypothetical protein